MNFQNLTKVEKYDFYLDVAFRRAREKAAKANIRTKDKIKKQKQVEQIKIDVIRDSLSKQFRTIIEAFPRLEDLPPFYNELVKCTLDYVKLRKSLGGVNWADKKVHEFSGIYSAAIRKTENFGKVKSLTAEYYGRISSFLKRIKPELAYIEESRRTMKQFPTIKTSLFTDTLFGYPNVGKTTILHKLTGSKPEINSYPFTTKGINMGYHNKVQFLDVPGALNRQKMNHIEEQAYLALKHCSHLIVFVFDLTEEYPIEKQKKLLLDIKRFKIPIIIYLSKADLVEKEKLEEFKKRFNALTDFDSLKKAISSSHKQFS